MTDEQLLEEYGKEIHRGYYNSHTDKMNVARLIESHRHLRNRHTRLPRTLQMPYNTLISKGTQK